MVERTPRDETTDVPKARARWTRSALSLVGLLLVIVSIALVGVQLRHQLGTLRELLTLGGLVHLALGGLCYGASLLLISYAFWLLLRWQGVLGVSLPESHRVYGRTQIAKYLPGNVFQILARHVEYRLRGAGDVPLGLAALYEVLGLAAAAASLAIVGLPFLGGRVEARMELALVGGLGAAVCGTLLVPALVAWVSRRRGHPSAGEQLTARRFARLLLLYSLFFVVSGALAFSLHSRASQGQGSSLSVIPGYALAWLCGFAVPGAAAGLGVREAVLLLLFRESPAALFAALGMRVVTTLGDICFFAAVTLWGRLAAPATEPRPSARGTNAQGTGERPRHQ
jgi:glycosyltransferase 2 family protein